MKLPEPQATDFREKLAVFEGRIPWMYLDTAGNVTIGIGHMLPTVAAVEALDFTGGTGSLGQAMNDWHAVKASTPGLAATRYGHLSICRLSDEAIDALCDADESAAMVQLAVFVPGLGQLPANTQQAILDMAFNLGAAKEHAEYFGPKSKFGPAIARGDWATAALESARNGIQPERNEYAAALILSAVSAVETRS